MSGLGDRFRKTTAAVWPIIDDAGDGYGDEYGEPFKIKVCHFNDNKVKMDQNGQEFVPTSAFDMGVKLKFGDLIMVIDADDEPSPEPDPQADKVRAIKFGTELRGPADYLVYVS